MRNVIDDLEEQIADIFVMSESQNLRVFRRALQVFDRMLECLSDRHLNHQNGIEALLRLVVGLAIDVMIGRLPENSLSRLAYYESLTREKGDGKKLRETSDRYRIHNLMGDLVPLDLLNDLISHGHLQQDRISRHLDNVYYFSDEPEPSWQTVWWIRKRTDQDVENAIKDVEKGFFERRWHNDGELLQIFGLRLALSLEGHGLINYTREEVVSQCKKYICDVERDKQLEVPANDPRYDPFPIGYAGLTFWQAESNEMQVLMKRLSIAISARIFEQLPVMAERLMQLASHDPDAFCRQICRVGAAGEPNTTAILSYVEPEKFVTVVLELNPVDQVHVFDSLGERYKFARADDWQSLDPEREWLTTVCDQLQIRSKKISDVAGTRMKMHLKKLFSTVPDVRHV